MPLFVRHKKPGPLKPTPNPYPSRFQRWRYSFWRYSFWIICFVVLMGIGGLRFHAPFYEKAEGYLFEGTAFLQHLVSYPFQKTQSFVEDTTEFIHLRRSYEDLQAENKALKWQLQTLSSLEHENKILRKSLNIPAFNAYGYITARVFSTPYDGIHHFFLIEAGENKGLEKNQAVICPEGIVGRLQKVGASLSRVLLLNDVSSRIPVVLVNSKQKAILAGEGQGIPTLVYLKDVQKIEKGEKVETSGLGGIFPPGLPVGIIEDVTNGKVTVRPYVPLGGIEWVHILKSDPIGDEIIEEVEAE